MLKVASSMGSIFTKLQILLNMWLTAFSLILCTIHIPRAAPDYEKKIVNEPIILANELLVIRKYSRLGRTRAPLGQQFSRSEFSQGQSRRAHVPF